MVNIDITEASAVKGFPQFDLSSAENAAAWEPTKAAYDVSINNLPFFLRISNQYPYGRQTAQYKKDQFDASTEPGEQSLTGWWLRSQTSWHDGAGISYYEPGVENNVNHKFKDSRGIDIWNIGEVRMLPSVFNAYTGVNKINAAVGNNAGTDVLVSGDLNGILKRITLNGNSAVSTANYVHTATSYPQGHSGSNFPFTSVTTSGGKYYATCSGAIHRGTVGTLDSDVVFAPHNGGNTAAFVKYAKGFVFFGENNILNLLDAASTTNTNNHTAALPAGRQLDSRTHLDSTFIWNDIAGGQTNIYASGNAGNSGEIWKIGFDGTPTATSNGTLLPDLSGSTVNATLPDGEIIKAIHYYLGYVIVGTNIGIRICPVNVNGDLTLGPLLVETGYSVNGFTERGTYIYAATKAKDSSQNINGVLIRIDLSQPSEDGTFPYAYDLEYESTPDGSDCTEVYNVNNRLVMIIEEDGSAGELLVEHTTNHRTTGFLETGLIRYATVEPKFFKYLKINGSSTGNDTIDVYVTDHTGAYTSVDKISTTSYGADLPLSNVIGSQETIGIKLVFNNASSSTSDPVMTSYQLKSLPASKRQRLIEYPLSCFDVEMDRFNASTGYAGNAYLRLSALEALEELGDIVTITDYRTNESYQGLIEDIKFSNESSPDKNNNGYGGIVIVTVRKI